MFWFGKQKREVLNRLMYLEGFATGSAQRADQARAARANIRRRLFELECRMAKIHKAVEELRNK